MALPMMKVGAVGVISVASHIAGKEIAQMVAAFHAGDLKKAEALHDRLLPLFNVLFITANPTPVKAALAMIGLPVGIPRLPLNLTLLKSCNVCGVFWGAFAARNPAANQAHVAELFALWDAGKISPRVSATYPLERAGEAIAAMAARQVIGKLVVEIG